MLNFKSSKNKKQRIWVKKVVQITRVTKVGKGGKKFSFRAIVIIGNKIGQVGVGIGKSEEIVAAITKGIRDAKRNIIKINVTKKTSTIKHFTIGCFGACSTFLKPAAAGTGVIAGSSIRTVLELVGIKNILAKQLGSNNSLNNARATICALQKLKTLASITKERNLPL
jgi:small subunit ribosomal protein S5